MAFDTFVIEVLAARAAIAASLANRNQPMRGFRVPAGEGFKAEFIFIQGQPLVTSSYQVTWSASASGVAEPSHVISPSAPSTTLLPGEQESVTVEVSLPSSAPNDTRYAGTLSVEQPD